MEESSEKPKLAVKAQNRYPLIPTFLAAEKI
jgi:hypothetical protein